MSTQPVAIVYVCQKKNFSTKLLVIYFVNYQNMSDSFENVILESDQDPLEETKIRELRIRKIKRDLSPEIEEVKMPMVKIRKITGDISISDIEYGERKFCSQLHSVFINK